MKFVIRIEKPNNAPSILVWLFITRSILNIMIMIHFSMKLFTRNKRKTEQPTLLLMKKQKKKKTIEYFLTDSNDQNQVVSKIIIIL